MSILSYFEHRQRSDLPPIAIRTFRPRTLTDAFRAGKKKKKKKKKRTRVELQGELRYLLPTVTTDLTGEQWRDWTLGVR